MEQLLIVSSKTGRDESRIEQINNQTDRDKHSDIQTDRQTDKDRQTVIKSYERQWNNS